MSDAAGDTGTARGNLTVGYGQGRACRRFAASRLRDDRNMPQAIIGRLGERGGGGRAGNSKNKQYLTNAIETHESVP